MRILLLAGTFVLLGVVAGWAMIQAEFRPVVETFYYPNAVNAPDNEGQHIGPRAVVVNGEVHSFGTMERDTNAEHVFVVKNVGDAPLNMEKGETTCKCTVSEMVDNSIPPGGSAKITLRWTAADPGETVEFRQVARFRTNDPNRPLIELIISGFITQSIRATPEELLVDRLSANEENLAYFNLFAYQHQRVEVLEYRLQPEAIAEHFTLEFRPLTSEELQSDPKAVSGQRVTVRIRPGLPLGKLEGTLTLKTNAENNPDLDVAIHGSVISDLSIVGGNFKTTSNVLTLGSFKQSVGAKANLHILVKGPYRNDIQMKVAATSPSDVLKATIGEPDRSNDKIVRYPLTIEVPPGSRQMTSFSTEPETAAKVILESTHPQAKELQVLVRFAVEG
ncbi:MAG: DUF1573 domain-containing protein [Pirellulaceae bacterium]|nr:DUF1573 domain-containing protein [Pirellulaceae bacterium]